METAYFRNIRRELINSLRGAQREIRIAVAWFTNQELFDTLISCLEKGVKVHLMIIDDYINNGYYGLDFQLFINKGGFIIYSKEDNPAHHKFCIIDDIILFTGSYNWTYYAENKNYENIVKIENSTLIKQYIEEFEILKKQLGIVESAHKILLDAIETTDYCSMKKYIATDLTYKAKETYNIKFIQEAINLCPENTFIKQEYKSFEPLLLIERSTPATTSQSISQPIVRPITLKETVNSIGIGCVNNVFSIIVPKSTKIPCEFSEIYFTVYDNQESISIEIYKGENPKANMNVRIGSFFIRDLPLRPAGKASVTVAIVIKEDMEMIVKAKSNDTGNEIETNYYDKTIAK